MKTGVSKQLMYFLWTITSLATSFGALAAGPESSAPEPYQTTNPAGLSGVEETEQQRGPFAIGEQNYRVVLHIKRLVAATSQQFAQTLAGLEIRDAAGNLMFEQSFPLALAAGGFQQSVSASVERFSGKTGAGLVVHYIEQTPSIPPAQSRANEFWQLFGPINGKLALLPKPAILGEAGVGAPLKTVRMRAANGTVVTISQPDVIEVRAWTGNFYVFVPLRVNWAKGGLAQGQRCMEMSGGGLREVGCDMRVEAVRKPPSDEYTFLRLFAEHHDNPDAAQHVVVQKNSNLQILGSSAIITWNETGGLTQSAFSDVWLRVSVDGKQGWIHGEEDFAAVGLPAGSPTS